MDQSHEPKDKGHSEHTSVVVIVLPTLLITLLLIMAIVGRIVYKRCSKRTTRIIPEPPNYRAVNNLSYSIVEKSAASPRRFEYSNAAYEHDDEERPVTPNRKTHVHKRGSKAYILSKKGTTTPGKVKRVVKRKQIRRIENTTKNETKPVDSGDELILYSKVDITEQSNAEEGSETIQNFSNAPTFHHVSADVIERSKHATEVTQLLNQTSHSYFSHGDTAFTMKTNNGTNTQNCKNDSPDQATLNRICFDYSMGRRQRNQVLLELSSMNTAITSHIEFLPEQDAIYATINKRTKKASMHDYRAGDDDVMPKELQTPKIEVQGPTHGQQVIGPINISLSTSPSVTDDSVLPSTNETPLNTGGTPQRPETRQQEIIPNPKNRKRKKKVIIVKRKNEPEVITDIAS